MMPQFPAYKTKPYYDALKTWLTTALNDDGTLRSDAVQAEVAAAIAAEPTVVNAAAAAVDATGMAQAANRADTRVFDVRAYGATGDGVTDNRPAFVAAIADAALVAPAQVMVPPGVFAFSENMASSYREAFTLPDGVSLIGSGAGKTSITWLDSVGAQTHMVIIDGVQDVEIAHIGFDGNKARLASALVGVNENEGINLKNGSSRVWVHHCTFTNFGQDAIDTDGCSDITISDIRALDNGGAAVHVTGTGTGERVIVENVVSIRNGIERYVNGTGPEQDDAAGFTAKSCTDTEFRGCISIDDARGFVISLAVRTKFIGCSVNNPGGTIGPMCAFETFGTGGQYVTFAGCTMRGKGGASGILLKAGGNYTITGNTFNNFTDAIKLAGCGDTTITGNHIEGNSYLINVASVAATGGWTVTGNTFVGGGGAYGLYVTAPRGTISGNTFRSGSVGVSLRTSATTNVAVTGNRFATTTGVGLVTSPTNCTILANDFLATTTPVTLTGTGHIIKANAGYDGTEKRGVAAAVADGGTIAHGFAGTATPTAYGVTGTVAGEIVTVTSVTAFSLFVAIKKHDGTAGTAQNIAWWAAV